ncbi:hypothetical protein TNCV_2766961 [Trichonephila clavipes]|nr:hypothetical protein TNCV_2766961 [Trichonephila clavipes]
MVPEEKLQGIEVRGARRQNNKSTVSPHRGLCSMEVVTHHESKKGAGAPSRVNHKFWCAMAAILPTATPEEVGNLHTFRFLQPYHHSFVWLLPSSASRPPDDYYHRYFHRLNVVFDHMFYADLSTPGCLLSFI